MAPGMMEGFLGEFFASGFGFVFVFLWEEGSCWVEV